MVHRFKFHSLTALEILGARVAKAPMLLYIHHGALHKVIKNTSLTGGNGVRARSLMVNKSVIDPVAKRGFLLQVVWQGDLLQVGIQLIQVLETSCAYQFIGVVVKGNFHVE
jgi:hypothetical protein